MNLSELNPEQRLEFTQTFYELFRKWTPFVYAKAEVACDMWAQPWTFEDFKITGDIPKDARDYFYQVRPVLVETLSKQKRNWDWDRQTESSEYQLNFKD